ncbi:hypothetical protein G6F43_004906 [Rhizopus delemar]|nr:hypothetical protein G6F43_004906 [Rhizopus delemar]
MTFIKHFKFNFHPKKQCGLYRLPEELLICVYQHLDTVSCTLAFASTCKRLRRIAQDPRSKASWMVTRYGVQFAIYYALLTIPEQCTRRFIQTLLHLGARVPRCLIQVLVQSYGKAEYQQRKQKGLKHDPFTITIQRIPFEGYVTLINQTSTLDIQRDSLAHFSSSLTHPTDLDWQKELDHHLFFPIPTHTAHNFRPILKLAQMDLMRYERIAPLFSIDPIARAALWQSILSVLFDEAFRTTPLTKERRQQLDILSYVIRRPLHTAKDQAVFHQAFADFFNKYPRGYCDQAAMDRMLNLLMTYVQPIDFSVKQALRLVKDVRSDIKEMLEKFI